MAYKEQRHTPIGELQIVDITLPTSRGDENIDWGQLILDGNRRVLLVDHSVNPPRAAYYSNQTGNWGIFAEEPVEPGKPRTYTFFDAELRARFKNISRQDLKKAGVKLGMDWAQRNYEEILKQRQTPEAQ